MTNVVSLSRYRAAKVAAVQPRSRADELRRVLVEAGDCYARQRIMFRRRSDAHGQGELSEECAVQRAIEAELTALGFPFHSATAIHTAQIEASRRARQSAKRDASRTAHAAAGGTC